MNHSTNSNASSSIVKRDGKVSSVKANPNRRGKMLPKSRKKAGFPLSEKKPGNDEQQQADDEFQEFPELRHFVPKLMHRTPMKKDEIIQRYRQFLKDCPDKTLTRDRFLEITGETLGDDADVIADTVFKVFDEDQDGQLNFCEYMMAVNSSSLETVDDKLKWIFRMYDKDFSGSIDMHELSDMFETLFEMAGTEVDPIRLEMLVTDVMQTLDEDGSGGIDIDEFVHGCKNNRDILQILCPDLVKDQDGS